MAILPGLRTALWLPLCYSFLPALLFSKILKQKRKKKLKFWRFTSCSYISVLNVIVNKEVENCINVESTRQGCRVCKGQIERNVTICISIRAPNGIKYESPVTNVKTKCWSHVQLFITLPIYHVNNYIVWRVTGQHKFTMAIFTELLRT